MIVTDITSEPMRVDSFFDKEFSLFGKQIYPLDALMGGLYIAYVAYYIKKFIDSFRDIPQNVKTTLREVQNFRDRVVQRIVYTAQAVGASMLFIDWGVEKGWFVIECASRAIFKVVANSVSILFWSYKCFQNIQNLCELPNLIERAQKAHVFTKAELEPEIYLEWINLFANFAFVVAGGLQILTIVTGVAVAAGSIQFLIAASMAAMVVGLVFDVVFGSHKKVEVANLLFSSGRKYTMLK